jgi:hypothetical protein
VENQTQFSIYPNPAIDRFELTTSSAEGARLTIYNIFGIVLNHYNVQEEKTQIEIEGFPSGVYLIELEQNGSIVKKRLIKK